MKLLVVDREVHPTAVIVRAKGELDSNTIGELTSHLAAALDDAGNLATRLVIIDLQALTYFGSAGLNALLDCHQQGREAGTTVRLVADNPLVVRPIEVTNLDSALELYPGLSDALEGREGQQPG
ncbi:STAS domain-containing protein [Mycobacterium fragae]|uniref:Anti-sigma factor antagonist n=1 Tax=Mycobacterium fragae TaxID=1260918 RepID=A0A1X1USE1_9MYCO|nr:STAS domain-containing protein [Mycobacterium fragae]MCV7402393.1 STAS domain-containing protein [Mycobacterium fragae]ORV59762.1 anti-anti-sigma factor [Mycobacterium fragae]